MQKDIRVEVLIHWDIVEVRVQIRKDIVGVQIQKDIVEVQFQSDIVEVQIQRDTVEVQIPRNTVVEVQTQKGIIVRAQITRVMIEVQIL